MLHPNTQQRCLLFLTLNLWLSTISAQDNPVAVQSVPQFSYATRASLKTITFQAAANLSDTLIFSTLVGLDTTSSVAFLFANTASAMAVYFPYELTWDFFGPSIENTTTSTIAIKTGFYQAITSARNLALSYSFSGSLLPSASFVIAAMAIDSIIYVANEYTWDIISPRYHH
jgi:hypothetical protein